MTPLVAVLVTFGEILGVCAAGMAVYGVWRLFYLRRLDVRAVRSLQPPPRGAVWGTPEYSDAEMDAWLDELIDRGGAQ